MGGGGGGGGGARGKPGESAAVAIGLPKSRGRDPVANGFGGDGSGDTPPRRTGLMSGARSVGDGRPDGSGEPSPSGAVGVDRTDSTRHFPQAEAQPKDRVPRVEILTPRDALFVEGELIEISGSAWDERGEDASQLVTWSSDGRPHHTPGRLLRTTLPAGSHHIRASFGDVHGGRRYDDLEVRVIPTPKF